MVFFFSDIIYLLYSLAILSVTKYISSIGMKSAEYRQMMHKNSKVKKYH
ncbi:hypothetical protein HMPREF1987_02202 [Peptostreptococcaceae bacterium oral taxon 113 str. W5053]|nr:hypothetical protein HMPREF1987_02202 [Peptostreptococcaceae bacterium oral taxon 113 str. W5053]